MSTITRDGVDNLAIGRHEPDWLKKNRLSAWEHYLSLPAPTVRDDTWRKTRLADLDFAKVRTSSIQKGAPEKAGPTVSKLLSMFEDSSGFVVSTDKHQWSFGLKSELKEKGVVVATPGECLIDRPQLLKDWLAKDSDPQKDGKFEFLSRALFNCGAVLFVPEGLEIEKPFVIIHALSENSTATATFPRILVKAGRAARFSVINIFTSEIPDKKNENTDEMSVISSLIDLSLDQGSAVNYVEMQNFASKVFYISKNTNTIGKDAIYRALTIGLGGHQLKTDIETDLHQAGAQSNIHGVVLGDRDEHLAYNTIQKHNAPDTTSNINFLVALKDRAVSAYQGNIMVARAAQKTNAFQSNKNLLLGEEAKADSIPKLEILADDVKCSHGATVGPVDKNQVFYLMSRGLDKK
ncbi:MAG: SufD family Fe-S cluster assembly protein, partial [Candidatus Obscuribacterales bacterium]|nr:SufD family Fe-S cluster assembly protein [Candidatus Obscuribacterales bacterium]